MFVILAHCILWFCNAEGSRASLNAYLVTPVLGRYFSKLTLPVVKPNWGLTCTIAGCEQLSCEGNLAGAIAEGCLSGEAEGKTWQLKGGVARCDEEMAQVCGHMWNCCCNFERECGGQRGNLLLGCFLCCWMLHIRGSRVFLWIRSSGRVFIHRTLRKVGT